MAVRHPLEDEHVRAVLTLYHMPTGTFSTGEWETAADDPETVSDAVDKAKEQALDGLLEKLETQGG